MPTLRTVSIIPGIETAAPERTETSSGSLRVAQPAAHGGLEGRQVLGDLLGQPSGSAPCASQARQASVVMVKPGGTGRPSLVISARFAPLPPSRSAWSLPPCAKSKT